MMVDRIEIVPYDLAWPERFRLSGRSIRGAFDQTALRIDHIGSTAVPGLGAKPIIDIQISVGSFDLLDAYRLPLEGLGYVFRGDNPDHTKRYFREAPGAIRTHIHVRRAGSWSEQFALLFRDYLRRSPEAAERYAAMKIRLAAQYGQDRRGYTEAKGPIIWEIMREADRWSQEVGWEPGPTDE